MFFTKLWFNHILITVVLPGMVVLKKIVLNLVLYRNDVHGKFLSVDYYTPSESMFNELRWERLSDRNQYFKALMMYISLHNLAPQYLTRKFKYVSDIHNCNTRQAAAGQLALPSLNPW